MKPLKKNGEYRGRWIAAGVLAAAFFCIIGYAAWSHRVRASDVVVDATALHLEIADTDAARVQGLSDRPSLDADTGMLFIFPSRGIYPFWMKDMHFPLDIIWIDGDRIVDIVTLPPPAPGALLPPSHTPTHLADQVLEINAGEAKTMGLKIGVRVLLAK